MYTNIHSEPVCYDLQQPDLLLHSCVAVSQDTAIKYSQACMLQTSVQ